MHSPASGPGTIAALPAHSELLGGSGQLESTVSDEAVLTAARKARIISAEGPSSTVTAVLRSARQGNQQARALLAERARVLGEAVALLRDMLNPDDLVVGGQAFTEYPEGMTLVEAAYAERSVLPARDIRVTAFGNRVQEAGAGVVSLGGLYSTGLGHGDAIHVSDLDPNRPGLEVFAIHENPKHPHGTDLRDARTGEILWSKPSRAVPDHAGVRRREEVV